MDILKCPKMKNLLYFCEKKVKKSKKVKKHYNYLLSI